MAGFAAPIIRNIKGDAGADGTSVGTFLSGETVLGGHRIVYIASDETVHYASNNDITHVFAPIGISKGAVGIGVSVDIALAGTMDEPSWAWTPQSVLFLGTNGNITTTPPTIAGGALFSQVIGFAITATKIQIQIHQPIILA